MRQHVNSQFCWETLGPGINVDGTLTKDFCRPHTPLMKMDPAMLHKIFVSLGILNFFPCMITNQM